MTRRTDEPELTCITVITLTRRRPELVQRAMRSVQAQRTRHLIHHMVLIDDCPDTHAALAAVAAEFPLVDIRLMGREPHEVSGPGRSSRLRNVGVQSSGDPWIAFLDDDNEWLPDHLETLVDCAHANGVRAAHSYVSLTNSDGSPFLESRWPWARTEEEAASIYQDYVAKGIVTPGSNVIGDRPGFHDEPADTSSWLLARDLLAEVPFEEEFSAEDAANLVGEDDKLFFALIARGEPIACSRVATLKYYLGGYSNSAAGKTDSTFSWAS